MSDEQQVTELEVNYEMRDACVVRFQCSQTVIEISGPANEAVIAQQLIEMLPELFLDAIQQEQEGESNEEYEYPDNEYQYDGHEAEHERG